VNRRRLLQAAAAATTAAAVFVLACNLWVVLATRQQVICDAARLPAQDTALLLGTSPYARRGGPSGEFHARIAAAAELLRLHKVQRLIASGTNPEPGYNEPGQMQQALLDSQVPAEAIRLDTSGDSTWESVRRMESEFGLRRYTIVTSKYHTYRAVFMAQQRGHEVVAYCAPGRSLPLREIFARVKAALEAVFLPASAAG